MTPRTIKISIGALFALVALSGLMTLLVALVFPSLAGGASNGNSGYVRRYAANFATYGGPPEIVTNAPPAANGLGGLVIYNKNFFVADDINTLYVTISATGDQHRGARLELSCIVDSRPCNPGPNPVGGSPSGWITLGRHDNYNDNYAGFAGGDGGGGAGDLHDNTVMKTWCTPFETKAGTHNVQVRLASGTVPNDPGSAGGEVFLEGVDFTIDGARVADEDDRCTNNTVDATVAMEPSTTTAPDGTLIDTTTFAPLSGLTTLNNPLEGHQH
jgi:hypothetical protein